MAKIGKFGMFQINEFETTTAYFDQTNTNFGSKIYGMLVNKIVLANSAKMNGNASKTLMLKETILIHPQKKKRKKKSMLIYGKHVIHVCTI